MTLNEQRIVVIGGSSGMGLATAQAAARAGAAVTVVSSRPERVDAALAELPEAVTAQSSTCVTNTPSPLCSSVSASWTISCSPPATPSHPVGSPR